MPPGTERQPPMRSTKDIIVAVKESQPATPDELRMALLVMSAVDGFTWRELYDLIEAVESDLDQAKMKATFAKGILERMYQARKEDPETWLAPDHMPGTADRDRWSRIGKKLLETIEGKGVVA
jgi:hypothetical protein